MDVGAGLPTGRAHGSCSKGQEGREPLSLNKPSINFQLVTP